MSAQALSEELVAIATAHDIDKVGVCSAEVFTDVRAALHERKAAGLSADMQFTYRNPDRATDPRRSLSDAETIVVCARSYRRSAPETPPTPTGTAAIAEYVWEPHYGELRTGLDAIAQHLREAGWSSRVLMDDNALVDRAAAYRAGIGWWGKNSNILVPGIGSKFVLGSVVTNAPLDVVDEPLEDQCGPCRRCIDACPTDAIVADGVIDSNRCLAWLVQSAGVFPHEFRVALGNRIYGCDDCQTSCPPNLLSDRRDAPDRTTGITTAAVRDLLTLDDTALLAKFGAWYIPRREPKYLRRNALIVLANTADPASSEVRQLIERYVRSNDEIEKAHAVWAADRLGYDDLVAGCRADGSEIVQAELSKIGGNP